MRPPDEDNDVLFMAPAPPPFAAWGPPHGMRRRRGRWFNKARRGDVRAGILALLAEQPMHGYQILQELESRSGGHWRPSAGSVYPTLQLLEDEGLVVREETDGRRVFSLTAEGRQQAESAREQSERLPWEEVAEGADGSAVRVREAVFQVGAAARQSVHAGTDEQIERVLEVLADSRRRIYSILAEEPEPPDA